jgi:hypothetical protein
MVASNAYSSIGPDRVRKDIDEHIDQIIAALTTPIKAEEGQLLLMGAAPLNETSFSTIYQNRRLGTNTQPSLDASIYTLLTYLTSRSLFTSAISK